MNYQDLTNDLKEAIGMLKMARCPNAYCENGTIPIMDNITYQLKGIEPCQWCDLRKSLIKKYEKLFDDE